MARAASKAATLPLVLVCGQDDFTVRRRAKHLFEQWTSEVGGSDHEVIDGACTRVSEALTAIRRTRESLNTLPFFGAGKVVWLQNCTFAGTDRTSDSQTVADALAELSEDIKRLDGKHVRLLISAEKVDRRKSFYKTLDKLGQVETHEGWSLDSRDWSSQAEAWAEKAFEDRGKKIGTAALAELITRVGPSPRQLDSEVEKLCLYAGERPEIRVSDVEEITSTNKSARAFALGEALGDRDLRRVLRCLDEELWEVKLDPQKSEIGLLYGLISKIRALLLLKELCREGWIRPEMDYAGFKNALASLPAEQLPSDRKFNPAAIHPYTLHKALPQVKRYSTDELIRAMDTLLSLNLALVSTGAEVSLAFQQALVQIVGAPTAPARVRS